MGDGILYRLDRVTVSPFKDVVCLLLPMSFSLLHLISIGCEGDGWTSGGPTVLLLPGKVNVFLTGGLYLPTCLPPNASLTPTALPSAIFHLVPSCSLNPHSTESHSTSSHCTVPNKKLPHRRHPKENHHTTKYPTGGYPTGRYPTRYHPTEHHPIIPTESIPHDAVPQKGTPQQAIPQEGIPQGIIPEETIHVGKNTMADPSVNQEARPHVKSDPDADQDVSGGFDNDNINQLTSTSSVLELECKQR